MASFNFGHAVGQYDNDSAGTLDYWTVLNDYGIIYMTALPLRTLVKSTFVACRYLLAVKCERMHRYRQFPVAGIWYRLPVTETGQCVVGFNRLMPTVTIWVEL